MADLGAAIPKVDRPVAMQEIRSSRPWAWQSAANTGCSDPNCRAMVPTQAPVATQTIRTDPTRATLPEALCAAKGIPMET
jgi:hypothetical protein